MILRQWLREQYKAQWRDILLEWMALIVRTLTMLYIPVLVSGLIAKVVSGETINQGPVVFCTGMILLCACSIFFHSYIGEYAMTRMNDAIRTRIWTNHMYADYASCRTRDENKDYQTVIRQGAYSGQRYFATVPNLALSAVLLLVIMGVMIFMNNSGIAILLVAGVPLCILISFFIIQKYAVVFDKYVRQLNINEAYLVKTMEEVRFIKLFSFYQQVKHRLDENYQTGLAHFWKKAILDCAQDIVIRLFQVILMAYALYLFVKGNLSLAGFLLYEQYVALLYERLQVIYTNLRAFGEEQVAFRTLEELILPEEKAGDIRVDHVERVELRDVTFGYEENRMILQRFSCTFETGRCYLLKAPNGFGKSTLFDLLTGIERPQSGTILYNRIPVSEINLPSLRREAVCMLTQQEFFFGGNPDENVAFQIDGGDLHAVRTYMNELQLEMEQKEGAINETYSGGQKKKLALSILMGKAKLCPHPLVLMDEPANTLDERTNKTLKEMIRMLKEKSVVLMIVHDESFDDLADKIIYLDRDAGEAA